ncbi:PR4B [Linum grandiflorum]
MKFISATSAVAVLATVLTVVSASAARVINIDSFNASFSAVVNDNLIYDAGQSFLTTAKYNKYNPANHDWKLPSDLACKPYETADWGSKYGWVAYCLPKQATIRSDICGQCVRIQKIDMDYITARVVDQCTVEQDGGLVLDYETVFLPMEKTEDGRASGEVRVEYHFVSCYQ